mmetsp:Transcript_28081/g.66936  ORF Transcript_28081/g.66936 Transcript_28081/m.66936 type:complete len:482 (+) Transcript_28081:91-1536(+)
MGEEQPSGQETASDPGSSDAGDEQDRGHAEQDGGGGHHHRLPQAGPQTVEANPCPTASQRLRPGCNTAAVATLGTGRDKNDFFDTRSRIFREKAMVEIANDTNALNKLKHWLSSRTTDEEDEPNCQSYVNADIDSDEKKEDRQPKVSLEARSVISCAPSLGDGTFDRSLLTRDERIDCSDGDVEFGTARSARKRMFGKEKPLPGTEVEERVMGECSFFYSTMDDNGERQTTRGRKVSGAVSRVKREWTERRYRRRLRQSHFGNQQPSWYGETASEIRNGSRSPNDSTQENPTPEHRQAFLAAHEALNERYDNEFDRNRFAIRKQAGYEDQIDLDLVLENEIEGEENEIRADLTLSSLAIRGGLIKLPQDNVRLVHDPHLQPGILSVEKDDKRDYGLARRTKPGTSDQIHQHRPELSYVLTVDEHLYRRLVQEMVDSYRLPCGMYYCCHVTDGDHVGIGVAVSALSCIFLLLLIGMIIWPTD